MTPPIAAEFFKTLNFMEQNRESIRRTVANAAGRRSVSLARVAAGDLGAAGKPGGVHGAGAAGLRPPPLDEVVVPGDSGGDGYAFAHDGTGCRRKGGALETLNLADSIRDHFRMWAEFGEPEHIDAILELLNEDAAAHDPDHKRPSLMGKAPRECVAAILRTPAGGGGRPQ